MAITILIVAFLGRVLIATTSIWQLTGDRIDAFRDARSALQLMTNDLSRADANGDPKMLNLANISGTYATEAYAVFPSKNGGKSDLCAVGYYLDWDAGSKTFSLRRFFKDSNTVAPSLANSPVDFTTLYDRTKGTAPETLASYVWDLELRPGEGQTLVTLPTSDPSTKWNWVEVRFKAMSVNAGRKISGVAAIDKTTWSDPASSAYRTFILPNEQQFMTRILVLQNQ